MSDATVTRLFPTRLALHPARPKAPGPASALALLPRLWIEHALLERRLAQECARPRPDHDLILDLRLRRMRLRDRIAAARLPAGG